MATPEPERKWRAILLDDPMNTLAFWVILAEKMLRAAAVGAMSVWVTGNVQDIHQISWAAIGSGALVGALSSILLSLGGQATPGTLPQSFVPSTYATKRVAAGNPTDGPVLGEDG